MKEEEIRPIAENYVEEYCHLPDGEYTDGSLVCAGIGTALIVSRQLEKRIAELEEKISILLSCKNCPDNKGGYICQKEYEEKCLAQKIQYIKELQEENTELKDKLNNLSKVAEVRLANWQKYEKAYNEAEELLDKQIEATYKLFEENKELKEKLKPENCLKLLAKERYIKFTSEQLTKAKELLERLLITSCNSDVLNLLPNCSEVLRVRVEAEQFLTECEWQTNSENGRNSIMSITGRKSKRGI